MDNPYAARAPKFNYDIVKKVNARTWHKRSQDSQNDPRYTHTKCGVKIIYSQLVFWHIGFSQGDICTECG